MAARVPARLSVTEGRRFGLTVGTAFALLGALAWWRGQGLAASIALGIGVGLMIAAVLLPTRLGPVYRFWMGLAAVMSKVTTPIVMGIVYFVVVTPIGLLRRLAGKNAVVRRQPVTTFWVSRSADAERRVGMERQF